jgi:hypothetical protein
MSPEGPLVPCRPSPGRHVLYSAAPGLFWSTVAMRWHLTQRDGDHRALCAKDRSHPPGACGPCAAPGTLSRNRQVSRAVQIRRPASSVMTTS